MARSIAIYLSEWTADSICEKGIAMAKTYTVAVIPGDGTGPEVIKEGIKALNAISRKCGIEFVFRELNLGGERFLSDGTLLPEDLIEEIRTSDAIYLGAIGHPGVKPGILEREILLRLRFELDLYINLRPVILFPGVTSPLRDKGSDDIDFAVIRENTEGIYAGGGGFFKKGTKDEVAIQESINTRKGVERCIRFAYGYCEKRNKGKKLTLAAKTNVLQYESDLWFRVFNEISLEYKNIITNYQHIDALCMWMIKNPEKFDVIVTGNMFGDIITDIGAIIQGGLGIAAGGNINPGGTAMFEPIGGSAPKYANKNIINPMAAISAAQMMLEYFEDDSSDILLSAIKKVVKENLLNLEAGKMGFGTSEVGDLIVDAIENYSGR